MERIVEYILSENEFDSLEKSLSERGYCTHDSQGMGFGTIDDGKSTNFDQCRKFSDFTQTSSDTIETTLRVRDSALIAAVDSHFAHNNSQE